MTKIKKKTFFIGISIILGTIALLLLFYYLLSIFHELGHKKVLDDYGIKTRIKFNFPNSDKLFSMASNKFLTKEDCIKFNSLHLNQKTEALLAGIRADISVCTILIFAGLILIILSYGFYNKSQRRIFYILFYIGIFLILLAMARLVNVSTNLSYQPKTDVYWISNNLPC